MTINSIIVSVLRSPLHWMLSNDMAVITITGRKSSKPITLPINYYRDGDVLWVTSVRNRKWWRNLQGGALVMINLRGKEMHGFAETILDEPAVMERFIAMLTIQPQFRRAFGIRVNDDETLNLDDLKKTASERLFVKIKLKT